MGEFVSPDDLDEEEQTQGEDSEFTIPNVDFAGEGSIPITDAVESLSKITEHPEAFAVASHEQIVELQNENYQLRKELAVLREEVAALWENASEQYQGKHVVRTSGDQAIEPEAFDSRNPVESAKRKGPEGGN